MNIPKYVQEMMERSYFYYNFKAEDERCGAGYTIAIKKRSAYTMANTLAAEVQRLKNWVERQTGGECIIIRIPTKTTHGDQIAIVTIWDPVMQHIEKYIHP
jgi:hypothetical protein